jgi:non-ribosomal peptide synthetase component F
VLHGFVSIALHCMGFASNPVTVVPVENRYSSREREMIGMLANNIVLKSDLQGNETLREYLTRLARNDLAALGHQRVPYDEVLSAIARNSERDEPAALAIALQNNFTYRFALGDVEVQREELPITHCPYDLYFNFIENSDEGLTLELQYATDVYESGSAVRLAEMVLTGIDLSLETLEADVFSTGSAR